MIQVTVNGAQHRFDKPVEVSALLSTLNLVGKKVAVERNGEIVPKSAQASTLLTDGVRRSSSKARACACATTIPIPASSPAWSTLCARSSAGATSV
jgi:sulfur carrier protein